MRNNKGVSVVTLIITIIIIIILAAFTAPLLSNIINDSFEEDARVEIKNVQAVVENAKSLILTDQFMPNQEAYMISNYDLENKFGAILTEDEIAYIEEINSKDEFKAPYKYYLMTQERFDAEFGDAFNVSGIRENREYLVNYMDGLVVMNYDGVKITSRPDSSPIAPIPELTRGEVRVTFSPDGNMEWARQQATMVTITAGESTEIYSAEYIWTEAVNEPTSYTNSFSGVPSGTASGSASASYPLELTDETGNGWFLWVLVKYDDLGVTRSQAFRSKAFYIDNIEPSAEFDVDEIKRQ